MGKKLLICLLALVCVFATGFSLAACGNAKKAAGDDDVMEDGLSVVLSWEEAETLLAQANAATIRTMAVGVQPARAQAKQLTKADAVKILNQVLKNMQNAWAVYGYTEYTVVYLNHDKDKENQVVESTTEEFVKTANGEFYGYCKRGNNVSKYWNKIEVDQEADQIQMEYEINDNDGEVSYRKRINSEEIETMADFWYGKTKIADKILTEDDIAEIKIKNDKIYLGLSMNAIGDIEEGGISAQEQLTIQNGRIVKDVVHWEQTSEICDMLIEYQYNDDVDLSLLDLPAVDWEAGR